METMVWLHILMLSWIFKVQKTDIHSNKGCGIFAFDHAKVSIHLPCQHNTTHDNVGEDRLQRYGGSIANINADGTLKYAEEVYVEDDDDDY